MIYGLKYLTFILTLITLIACGDDYIHPDMPLEEVEAKVTQYPHLINSEALIEALSYMNMSESPNELEQYKRYFNFLLDNGADLNRQSEGSDIYPLEFAIEYNSLEIIQFCIEKGARVNIKTIEGSVLHSCIKFGRSEGLYKYLVEQGADVNKTNEYTPLTRAIKKNQSWIKLTLETGTIPTHIDISHAISFDTHIGLIRLMIEQNKQCVTEKDPKGRSSLHWIARDDSSRDLKPLINLLISHGADINDRNNKGETPLSIVKNRKYRSEKSLHGPDYNKHVYDYLMELSRTS